VKNHEARGTQVEKKKIALNVHILILTMGHKKIDYVPVKNRAKRKRSGRT